MCRIVDAKYTSRIASAFHLWVRAIADHSEVEVRKSERDALQECFRLRESLRAATARLREISRAGDIHAALIAEKALNRYLMRVIFAEIPCKIWMLFSGN